MIAQKMFFVVAVTGCMFASVSIGAVEPKEEQNLLSLLRKYGAE